MRFLQRFGKACGLAPSPLACYVVHRVVNEAWWPEVVE